MCTERLFVSVGWLFITSHQMTKNFPPINSLLNSIAFDPVDWCVFKWKRKRGFGPYPGGWPCCFPLSDSDWIGLLIGLCVSGLNYTDGVYKNPSSHAGSYAAHRLTDCCRSGDIFPVSFDNASIDLLNYAAQVVWITCVGHFPSGNNTLRTSDRTNRIKYTPLYDHR